MRRVVLLASAALALASCTSGTPKPTASGSATPSATRASATPSARSIVVAVSFPEGRRVQLYRVDERRHASLVRTIDPPRPKVAVREVALSAGSSPRVCAVWQDDDPHSDAVGEELFCDGVGRVGYREAGGISVALNPAGDEVFWSDEQDEGTSRYTVADIGPHALGARRTHELDCPRYVLGARWADDSHVVLHCSTGDSDDPGRLSWQELGESPSGAVDIPVLPSQPRGYDLLLEPGGYVDGGVLAVQRVDCVDGCPVHLPQRGVRVDPHTGRVLEVVAAPAKGREVASVTGGGHGVVYATYSDKGGGLRVYVRWPGERHGAPVTGLPADIGDVVAQP